MARVVQPRVDYDPAHGDTPRCWVCQQRWPYALSIVLDKHNQELRIDGGDPIAVRGGIVDVLAVLVNSHPRWISRDQLVEHAFAERPDVDMPTPQAAIAQVASIRRLLRGSQYRVESDQSRGWRLVSDDHIERERREYLAQIPDTGMRRREDVARMSAHSISKTEDATTKPKRMRRFSEKHPEGLTKRSNGSKGPTPLLSKKNQYAKSRRLRDVRPK